MPASKKMVKMTGTKKKTKSKPVYTHVVWKPPYQSSTVLVENLDWPHTAVEWKEILDDAVKYWKRLAETPGPYLNAKAIEKVKAGPAAWLSDDDGYVILQHLTIESPIAEPLDTALYLE